MARFADITRQRGRRPRSRFQIDLPVRLPKDEGPGILSSMWQPFATLFDWMGEVDEATRGALGTALGMPEARAGESITGEELFEYVTGLELPEGTEGDIELRDVPGFATDVLVSPFNVLTLGSLTAAGQTARRGTDLLRRARALRASTIPGRAASARELLPHIREVTRGARRQGVPSLLAPTLRGQAEAGQRALLGASIPSLGIRGLRETRLARGVPLLRGPRALGALAAGGRALTRPLQGLARGFRVGGRVSPGVTRAGLGRMLSGEDYNALVTATEETARRGRRIGEEERIGVRRVLEQLPRAGAQRALDRLAARLPPLVEDAIGLQPLVRRLEQDLARATARGDREAVERLSRRLQQARSEFREKYLVLGERAPDARQAALTIGLEQVPVIRKLHVRGRRLRESYVARIDRWDQQRAVALAAGDTKTARIAQGQMTRLRNRQTEAAAALAARQHLSREVWEALPREIQREVGRITLLTEDVLRIEQQTGVPVSELTDPLLGYLHRALTPLGRQFAAVLESLGVQTPFTRYARQFSPVKGFMRRRNRRFEGMGVMQINDWANKLAGELRQAMPGLAKKLDFGKAGFDEFFFEDPAEAIFRRLAAGGKAKASAEMFGGLVRLLHVPAAVARAGDVSTADFLARTTLRRFGDQKLGKTLAAIGRQLEHTAYAGSYIPKEFADEALRIFKTIETPEELKNLGRMFDQYNAMMRYWVTVPFAGYHIRNALSNVWLSWLAGMRNPAWYARAVSVQRNAARSLREGVSHPDLDLYRRMQDLGAVGGTMTAELETVAREAAAAAGRAPGARLPGALRGVVQGIVRPTQTRAGQWTMRRAQDIENNAKVALFMDGKARRLSDIEAAERVKKYLFDYTAIGPLDKVARKWAYFWTFFRKNLPLEIQSLVTDTRKMHFWGLLSGHVGDTAQKEMLAEYQQSRSPIVAGETAEGRRRFLSFGLPFDDLFTFSGEGRPGVSGPMRIVQRTLAMGAPAVRAIPEIATGRSLDTGEATTARRILGGLTPASRFISSARLGRQVAKGERPASQLGRLVGVSEITADPRKAQMRQRLRQVREALGEMALRGQARPFTVYGAPAGDAASARLDRLNRLRRSLETSLARPRLRIKLQ